MTWAPPGPIPGDLIQALQRRDHGGARPGAGGRAGAAIGVHAARGGHHPDQLPDAVSEPGDLGVQLIDLVQQHPGQLGVMLIEPAGERLDQGGPLSLHLAAGQIGQHPRAALPADQRLDHVPDRQRVDLAGYRRHLNKRVFQQLLQPGPVPGAFLDQVGPQPGVVPQLADLRWRHERGPQHAPLGQLGKPHRIELVALGPARHIPGLAGIDQLHIQASRLQQVKPDPPVIARRLDRYLFDPLANQVITQLDDRAGGGIHIPYPADPPARLRLVRHPHAHLA
jgi:hypothetical protein